MHERTGRADFRTWAEDWTANLEGQKNVTSSHDVGFQVFCSFGQGRRIAEAAASGFLELETLTGDPAKQAKFHDAAWDILYSLCSSEYLAQGTGGSALLRHGYYHGPKSVIFGDYYFLEALVRYCAAAGR